MAIQYPSNNIHGEPGERWTNETDKVWWQLKVDFINSCGQCIQYANTLARFWPVPFHPGCNCRGEIGDITHSFVRGLGMGRIGHAMQDCFTPLYLTQRLTIQRDAMPVRLISI